MSDGAFQRGDVVWHPAPFKRPPRERPFVVLSGDSHPFHGSEYATVGLTRTNRPRSIELGRSAWAAGDPGGESYASPWYVFTIKHADVVEPKGTLTADATENIATATADVLGVR